LDLSERLKKDRYLDRKGDIVFTEKFLIERKVCCGLDCKHCPYFPKHEAGNKKLSDKFKKHQDSEKNMQKFDPSCGLSAKLIRIIKYNVMNSITRKLPFLPDSVETKLFLEGRDAWMFRWHLLNEKFPIFPNEKISLEVLAILKKEFHDYQDKTLYRFLCNIKLKEGDNYHPELSIVQEKTN
jgi:hypothetical protein